MMARRPDLEETPVAQDPETPPGDTAPDKPAPDGDAAPPEPYVEDDDPATDDTDGETAAGEDDATDTP